MFRINPRFIGVEEARRREALAHEIGEAWRVWAEFKLKIESLQLETKWDGQPRDDRGRYSFGKKPKDVQLAGDITGFTRHGINQAISRGVSPGAMHDAVVRPLQILPQANGTTQYIGRGAVAVLNPLGQV